MPRRGPTAATDGAQLSQRPTRGQLQAVGVLCADGAASSASSSGMTGSRGTPPPRASSDAPAGDATGKRAKSSPDRPEGSSHANTLRRRKGGEAASVGTALRSARRDRLLKEAVALLKGFYNDCEEPARYVGKERLGHRTYKSGRGRWVLKGRVVPPGTATVRLWRRVRSIACGRCWDCRRRAFLKKAAKA